jgi:ABC-type branched-subunit amino acid transport system substrate-binding protein
MKCRVRLQLSLLGAALITSIVFVAVQYLRAEGAEPLKIGLLIQLSGAAGVYGTPSKQAAELAVAEINQAGGVLGRNLQLVIADDATDVKTAGEQVRKLVNQDHVDVLISTESSAAREAVIPVVKRGNTLMIYTPLYEGGACEQNLFDLGEVPQQQLEPVIPYMQAQYDGKTWYIVGDDYNWPRALGKATRSFVAASGGSVVGEDYVPLGTSDFGTILDKVRTTNASFVLLTLVGSDAIAFVKQLHDFGLGDKVKTLSLALLDNTLPALTGNTSNTFAAFGYFSTLNTTANATFIKALHAKFGANTPQQTTLSEGDYDAIHLWAQAVRKAGTPDAPSVVKAMGGESFNGPRGTLTVSGTTHHVAQHIYLAAATPDATYRILHDFGLIEPGPQCAF